MQVGQEQETTNVANMQNQNEHAVAAEITKLNKLVNQLSESSQSRSFMSSKGYAIIIKYREENSILIN